MKLLYKNAGETLVNFTLKKLKEPLFILKLSAIIYFILLKPPTIHRQKEKTWRRGNVPVEMGLEEHGGV